MNVNDGIDPVGEVILDDRLVVDLVQPSPLVVDLLDMDPWAAPSSDVPESPGQWDGFTFTQTSPSAQWIINHNLGRSVVVTAFDSGGAQIEGDLIRVSNNQAVINFTTPISGSAICL